jgi:tetratricopeptide (TPR) repeat protein
MLLEQKKVEESIPFLITAESKKNRKDISHNLGFAYFLNKEYQKAYSKFKSIDSELDLENLSLYNLALCQLQLELEGELKDSLEKLESTIEKKIHKTIDGYGIAQLYATNGEYQKCYDCVELQGFDMIEITDWPIISYSIKKINSKVWGEQIDKYINQKTKLITEFENGNEEEDGYNKEERAERIIEIKQEINILTKTKESETVKPKTNLVELLTPDHCGCLLFGCKTHGNIKNDE